MSMQIEEVQRIVEQAMPGAQVKVKDLTGTRDHFRVEVVSEVFRGKLLIQQHLMVQAPLKEYVNDERIHALSIRTYTPEEWQKNNLVSLD